jgi:hypothetical protein
MRVIEAYFNVDYKSWCSSDGSPLPPHVHPAVGIESTLLRIHLVHNNGVEFTDLALTNTFESRLVTALGSTGTTLALASASDFNVSGDWPESSLGAGDGTNVLEGRISIRLNCATTELATALGTSSSRRYWFTLTIKLSGVVVGGYNEEILACNTPYGALTPVPITGLQYGIATITNGESSVVVTPASSVGDYGLTCTLIAPTGSTDNITIANVIVSADKSQFTVYLTSPVPSTGWKVSYQYVR